MKQTFYAYHKKITKKMMVLRFMDHLVHVFIHFLTGLEYKIRLKKLSNYLLKRDFIHVNHIV